ncbi:MAG: hypothetical protein AMXMBFR13_46720 [Phycisphaerae bacterium]
MPAHRILIVGAGSIGERHLRCFRTTGRVETAVCETNPTLLSAVVERYPGTRGYTDLDTALADKTAGHQIALIAVPSHLHIPVARRIVDAGLHVFVEKPLSTSQDGVAELVEAVGQRGVLSAVVYTYRSHPALRGMRDAIAGGRFGRPVQVVSTWGQHFPKYRPAYRNIYYTNRATGGGAIQDVMTHAINAGEFLAGPVDRLMADAAHLVLEGVEVEDTVHVLTRQAGGGVLGCYSLNQHQAPNENSITVICERGTARFELNNARWLSMIEPGGEWAVEHQFSMERDDIFIHQANLLLDAVEGRGPIPCTLEEGWQTLRVNLGIMQAVERQSWIDVRK